MEKASTRRWAAVVRYGLAATFLGFGIWNSGLLDDTVRVSSRWVGTAIALYALPLVAQAIPSAMVRVLGLWFGVFLVAQTLATPLIKTQRDSFVTLKPNLDYKIDVDEGAIPGIVGVQHITTDEKGFRVTPPVDYTEKSGLRIFTIGGSTTVDIYLDDRATWTHHLQENLKAGLDRPVEAINTGAAGLRAEHHLATLREVSIYQPDVVIFLVGVNDWNRAIRLAMDSEQTAWLGKFPSSILGQMINEAYIALVKRSSVTGGVFQEDGAFFNRKRKSMLLPDRREYFPDDVSPAYAGELQDIANECQILEALCVFLTQPHGYHPAAAEIYIESFWMTPPGRNYTLTLESMVHIADLYNQHLLEFARSNGFLAFDLAAHIEPSFQSFYDEVHFNTQGAKAVGDLVAQFLLAHPNQLADLPPAKTAGSVDY